MSLSESLSPLSSKEKKESAGCEEDLGFADLPLLLGFAAAAAGAGAEAVFCLLDLDFFFLTF